jgi:hypothetical protein
MRTHCRWRSPVAFVLDDALGTERVLGPGEVSGPVVMRVRVKDPLVVPNMHLVVTGSIPVP